MQLASPARGGTQTPGATMLEEWSMGVRSVQSWRSAFSAFVVSVVVSAAGLAQLACDKTSESASPNGPAASGAVAAEPAGGEAVAGAGGQAPASDPAAAAAEPAAPPCQPDLDIQATSFFAHRILLTLPKGVELVEQNPFFARSASPTQTDSCGVAIPFAAVGYVRSSASLAEIRQHVMLLRGFDNVTYSAESSQGGTTIATYDVSAKGTSIRGLVFFKQDGGWYYWGLFEASPEAFGSLERLYRASIGSLLIRPVRGG